MKVITLQQRLRIMILILSLVVLSILGLVIYPTVRSILMLQQEINLTETFLEDQYERSRSRSNQVEDIDELMRVSAQFDTLRVKKTAELDLIESVEELAKNHGIVQQFQIRYSTQTNTKPQMPYYELSFVNNGTMDAHMDYLHNLLTLPYIVEIESVDFRLSNRTNSDTTEVTLRFSARVYVQ
jgi:hypothetical protein